MKQARMLHEAISAANRGERVIVTAHHTSRALWIKGEARKAVANALLQQEGQDFMRFKSGGEIRFFAHTKEEKLRGFRGKVYQIQVDSPYDEGDSLEDWELDSRYLPPSGPHPSRFERILNED